MTTPMRPLVSADWLKSKISAPDVRVIDATWFAPFLNPTQTGKEAYDKAHIPGAVFFDIDEITDPESAFAHTLPPAFVFTSRVRALGIGDGHQLVIYDRNNFFASARVWWMLRAMGVTDVLVLDGGFQAWLDAGGASEDLAPIISERHFTPRIRADLIKNTAQISALAEAGATSHIIDARPKGRFDGTSPEPRKNLKSGHIAGSLNVPGSDLLDQNGHMKSPEALTEVFKSTGLDIEAPAIATCGSGVTAAVAALALATLGNDLVAVYDGSWTEWASDPANPIATSAAE